MSNTFRVVVPEWLEPHPKLKQEFLNRVSRIHPALDCPQCSVDAILAGFAGRVQEIRDAEARKRKPAKR
jgi:hypothetical protein